MAWNWQHTDWPNFTWMASRMAKAEERFLTGAGVFVGTLNHLHSDDRERVTVEAISTEGLTTSEIEGEILDRESVQSSVRHQLGLSHDHRHVRPAERGIGELMADLYRNWAGPLDHATLFSWHGMIMSGHRNVQDVGRYRTHAEPMRIVSGRAERPKIHFVAPPSAEVAREMERFVAWFNDTGPEGSHPLPALTRAGLSHIYFESIHPFEDGNGRIGRAIAEKSLAQSLRRPTLTALAATILLHRRAYYEALEAANKGVEVTEWLAHFAATTLEAQLRTLAHVEFLIDKTRLLDRMRENLNDRQQRALLRLLREGPSGFTGGLSAGNYVSITKTSTATASRDLADMVKKGALTRSGDRKRTRYAAAIPSRPVPEFVVAPNGDVLEKRPPSR